MRLEPFEQKLREYFEQVQPSEEFLAQLKALDNSPEAKPKPRNFRRWLLPAAAVVMALVALGSGWAYLRASLPGSAPEPATAEPAPSSVTDYEPATSSEPTVPDESHTVEPEEPAESPAPETPEEDELPALKVPAAPESQTPVPAAPSESTENPENNPQESSEPGEPTETDYPAYDPDIVIEPNEQTEPDPNLTSEAPPISAEYLNEGGLETLILTNLNTGETCSLDVTGKTKAPTPQVPSSDPDGQIQAETASASGQTTYIGACDAFGWPVLYTVYRIDSDSAYVVAQAIHSD